MLLNKFLATWAFCLLVALSATAQTDPDQFIDRSNSPLSAYGIGDLVEQGFAVNRGLAGIHTTILSPFNVNFRNPASYTDILVTSFELGFHANRSNLGVSDKADRYRTTNTNPTYIAIGFPITKNIGFGGGIIPMSRVSYNVNENVTNELGEQVNLFQGDGDLYRSFLGLGYAYGTKKTSVSFGLNANYVFGKVNRSVSNFLLDQTSYLWAKNTAEENYSGWEMEYGFRFATKKTEESDLAFIVGITGDLGSEINLKKTDLWTRTAGGGVEEEVSSVQSKTKVDLPSRLAAGFSLQKAGQWTLALEFENVAWSSLKGLNNQDVFKDVQKFSIGYFIIPDGTAFNSYFKTIQYRLGAYYSTGNLLINNTEINEFALTMGLGLPVRRNSTRMANYSRLNLSMEVGQRGTIEQGLIQDNFIRVTFGITLNDKWFVKKKFD